MFVESVLVRCMTLNSAKTDKVNLKGDDKVLLIVCSTTGNGVINSLSFFIKFPVSTLAHDGISNMQDAPENAEAWWRTGNVLIQCLGLVVLSVMLWYQCVGVFFRSEITKCCQRSICWCNL